MSAFRLDTRIALVTGQEMAKPDPESHLLVAALAERGVRADLIPWQAACDWSDYPLVLVRTPWDYFRQRERFLAWAAQVGTVTRLLNPGHVLAWNSHKSYLRELAGRGVSTVPTLWLDRHAPAVDRQLADCGWTEVVIKPAVSIGAIGARRGHPDDPGLQAHLRQLVQAGDTLVQPYVEAVARTGELSLIYFGQRFSHAVCKRPRAGDYRVQDMYGGTNHPVDPPAEARALAETVLHWTPAPCTYARVDMVCAASGWQLMELELIEPELFLPLAPGAAARLADHLLTVLASPNRPG